MKVTKVTLGYKESATNKNKTEIQYDIFNSDETISTKTIDTKENVSYDTSSIAVENIYNVDNRPSTSIKME